MAVPARVRSAGRDGGQPVTGAVGGIARAASRRVPQVQRRSCQPGCGEYPAGPSRPRPPSAPACDLAPPRARYLARDHTPDGARRALRALEGVEKVLTGPLACRPVRSYSNDNDGQCAKGRGGGCFGND